MISLDKSEVLYHMYDKIREKGMLTMEMCHNCDFIIKAEMNNQKHILIMYDKTTIILTKLRNIWTKVVCLGRYVYHDEEGVYLLSRNDKKLMYWNAIVRAIFYADLKVGNFRITENLNIMVGMDGITYDSLYFLKVIKMKNKTFIHVNNFVIDENLKEIPARQFWTENGCMDISNNMWIILYQDYTFLNNIMFPEKSLCYGYISTKELKLLSIELKQQIRTLILTFKRTTQLKGTFNHYIPKSLLVDKILPLI